MKKITAAITGVGAWVPEYRLTNHELETLVDTSDEWITTRTGIKERRILKEPGKGSSYMAVKAIQELLHKTKCDPKEIELIICTTVTPDMPFPATACIIADQIQATNAFAFDLMSACSGFLYGLVTASKFIESGSYKKIIVVGVDKMSSIIDYTNRDTCVIFGDGAGAVLLEPNTEGYGVIDASLKSDGSGCEFLHMKAGGSVKPASLETVAAREHFVYQNGSRVFKAAVNGMADITVQVMDKNNLKASDIAWLVPHQANKRIIDETARRMGITDDKVMLNIERYGNTTNATLPLCLWEWESRLRKGDNLILSAFGAGFSWGAVYMKWAYP
jgi:3-oxoacyl-[acyl-carrier-protein] synthase-3